MSDLEPRGLIANVSKYRDHSQLAWITSWIGSDVAYASSSALRALARLDPDAAVAALRNSDPFQLAMSRNWAFAEIFERRPGETTEVLLELMRASPSPWDWAWIYLERENELSEEQLALLLDATSTLLDVPLDAESGAARHPYRELAFLARIAAPKLLRVLKRRRGTEFETVLTNYLLRIGPRTGRQATLEGRADGLSLLNLIGGTGLTKVANVYLKAISKYGLLDAIPWAAKRPNESTFRALSEIVASDATWDGEATSSYPLNQNEAMKVLARHGRWKDVADGLCKWGLETDVELRRSPHPIADKWVATLRAQVDATPTPGNLLTLATVGGNEDIERVHRVLQQCDPESELAQACIIALEDLNDATETGVALVVHHLKVPTHRYSAKGMLSQAGTPSAWDALFADLSENFDLITALNLINLSEHAEAVVRMVKFRIPRCQFLEYDLVRIILTRIRSEPHLHQILDDPAIRESFHVAAADAESHFWITGLKANAIECLALFDPKAAFAATCHALENENAHDRERYPSILMGIDSARGSQRLVEMFIKVEATSVRQSICRALEGHMSTELLLDGLSSSSRSRRMAFAELCGWAPLEDSIDEALFQVLDDPADEVIVAAINARRRRRDRRLTESLSDEVVHARDTVDRSVCFDALIGFADPGDAHSDLHPVLQRAFEAVPEAEARAGYLVLKKRRGS